MDKGADITAAAAPDAAKSTDNALVRSNRVTETDKRIIGDVSNSKFANHLFVRLVAKGRRFTKVDFQYTIFDSCYLRKCVFDSCNFTGARFNSSNLVDSSFSGCNFDYCSFEKTVVDHDILDTNCPGFENLKLRFARSLRINYQQLGDATSANKAMAIELQATEIHLHKAWRSKESYYRKKYAGLKRVEIFAEWIGFKILDLTWGNGESLIKLSRAVLIILLSMAFLDVLLWRNPYDVHDYITALLQAPPTFFGVLSPSNYPKLYLAFVTFVRLVFIGFFMSIIIKRFNRR